VSDKFRDATQSVLSPERAEAFLALTKDFEELPNLGNLLDTVTA